MVTRRRGATTTGCLGSILILAVIGYVGSRVIEPYLRYYNYRDAVAQEARFASMRTDEKIRENLWQNADSLSMPEGAFHLSIDRTQDEVRIRTIYVDSWTVRTYVHPVQFNIDVRRPL